MSFEVCRSSSIVERERERKDVRKQNNYDKMVNTEIELQSAFDHFFKLSLNLSLAIRIISSYCSRSIMYL